jgi:hypothetical protein
MLLLTDDFVCTSRHCQMLREDPEIGRSIFRMTTTDAAASNPATEAEGDERPRLAKRAAQSGAQHYAQSHCAGVA